MKLTMECWKRLKLEEIETGSKDILGVEGKINNRKCRLIFCYFDCTKQVSGDDYKRNRTIQTKIENLMEVDPIVYPIVYPIVHQILHPIVHQIVNPIVQ